MTQLASGQRVAKSSCQLEELGALDELNGGLGWLISLIEEDKTPPNLSTDADLLRRAQQNCFYFGSVLAAAPPAVADQLAAGFSVADVTVLEKRIDILTAKLPPLTNFILPGGCPPAAAAHSARALCRRAERIFFGTKAAVAEPVIAAYLNRLSDYLFTLARWLNCRAGHPEVIWSKDSYVSSI